PRPFQRTECHRVTGGIATRRVIHPFPNGNLQMSAPDSTPSAQPVEHDPFIIGLKQRLPEELRESFTEEQLRGLRSAFATRSWARHKLDLRATFNIWRNQYY